MMALASAAPVQLVTGDDYAPFTDRELPQGGMLTELVQQALLQAGHQPKLSWLPWKRGYQATLRGQFDATWEKYYQTAVDSGLEAAVKESADLLADKWETATEELK